MTLAVGATSRGGIATPQPATGSRVLGQPGASGKRFGGDREDWPAPTRVAARYEAQLAGKLRRTWATSYAEVSLQRIAAAIRDEPRRVDDVTLVIEALLPSVTAERVEAAAVPVLAGAVQSGADLAGHELAALGVPVRRSEPDARVKRTPAADLQAINPEAVRWARLHAAALVVGTADLQAGIRALVVASQASGIPVRVLARQIREIVGLDPRRMAALARFEETLRKAAVEETRIAARVARYADALRRQRALTIARTETISGLAHGQQALWRQAASRGLVDRRVIMKQWIVTPDDLLCFPARTSVLTLHGWRPISKIKVGDLVLTHQDRFRAVVAVRSKWYDGPTTRLEFQQHIHATATNGHRILTRRGWVQVETVTVEDEVAVSAKPCRECGAVVPSGPYKDVARCGECSRRMANKVGWSLPGRRERLIAFNKGRVKSDAERQKIAAPARARSLETRRKLSEKAKLRIPYERTAAIRAKQSASLRGSPKVAARAAAFRGRRNPAISAWLARLTPEEKLARLSKMMRGNTKASRGTSSIERPVAEWLRAQGLAFVPQWPFRYDDAGRARNGFADFYLPGANIVIECDGYFHAASAETRRRDALRDESLASVGVETLRFTAPQIKKDFATVASEIRSRCCIAWIRPLRVIAGSMRHQPVYDIQVAEDESFIAGGIVAHNCEICEALDGETAPLDGEFLGGLQGPPAHPNCRCSYGLVRSKEG